MDLGQGFPNFDPPEFVVQARGNLLRGVWVGALGKSGCMKPEDFDVFGDLFMICAYSQRGFRL